MKKKLKTHKGTSKRIKVTGAGKLIRRHASRSHHRGRKNVAQLFRTRKDEQLPKEHPRIKELIPYK